MKKKRIVFCADDFSLSPGITKAIIALLEKGKLSATSCMVTGQYWEKHSALLEPLRHEVDIGLHFNLTEEQPLSRAPFGNMKTFPPLEQLLLRSMTCKLDKDAIRHELNAQLDCFIDATGHLPAFIDGHQHIHHLPVIRKTVLDIYRKRLAKSSCYIRSVSPSVFVPVTLSYKQLIKQVVILWSGGIMMKNILRKKMIPCNTMFGGIYDFSDSAKFQGLMQTWLKALPDRGLLMCHPGIRTDKKESLRKSHLDEMAYFQSENFTADLKAANVTISRFIK